ncbi:MAG: DNA cytosine methyltransferase [Acidobacteriota bacterium]
MDARSEPRAASAESLRALELFCGIGGFAAAVAGRAAIVGAYDVSAPALTVYRHNFPDHPTCARGLDALQPSALAAHRADLWWLSPPCQPFTVRGRRRDLDDPRARPFIAALDAIVAVRPPYVALENVVGFLGSEMHALLRVALDDAGYRLAEHTLCPSDCGVPNRRPRYYALAAHRDAPALEPLPDALPEHGIVRALADALDPQPFDPIRDAQLVVPPALAARYAGALTIVDARAPSAGPTITSCFTAAYGRSPVRSGAYLREPASPSGLRRFRPSEILRLLGFPSWFTLPEAMPPRLGWRLVGNSLALVPVRALLMRIPALRASLRVSSIA